MPLADQDAQRRHPVPAPVQDADGLLPGQIAHLAHGFRDKSGRAMLAHGQLHPKRTRHAAGAGDCRRAYEKMPHALPAGAPVMPPFHALHAIPAERLAQIGAVHRNRRARRQRGPGAQHILERGQNVQRAKMAGDHLPLLLRRDTPVWAKPLRKGADKRRPVFDYAA